MLTRRNRFLYKNIRWFSSQVSQQIKLCIVGGGPAGFYAAQQLIKLLPDSKVDIYEKLPVPFGLVRYGVAPDHPEVKNVINTFTKTASHPSITFLGNVSLGKDVSLKQLQNNYHVVLLTYGADEDKKFNLPGEGHKNVISARDFVNWYNGLPSGQNLEVNLDVEDVVILGQGNVAVDVARIMLTSIDELRKTDITNYSLEMLTKSRVKRVVLVGRRGPLQVAFTIKELREMINLPDVKTVFNKDDFVGVEQVIANLARPRKRLIELLYKTATGSPKVGSKNFEIMFKRSPIKFVSNEDRLQHVTCSINRLEESVIEKCKAVLTDATEDVKCGLALRSIGYRSIQADADLPFDDERGVALNQHGRIFPGLYCSGWLSTGPLGVILSTMNNAFTTGHLIHKDITQGAVNISLSKPGSSEILSALSNKGVQVVSFEDWKKIDKEEERRGSLVRKPREKIVDVEEMLKIAAS